VNGACAQLRVSRWCSWREVAVYEHAGTPFHGSALRTHTEPPGGSLRTTGPYSGLWLPFGLQPAKSFSLKNVVQKRAVVGEAMTSDEVGTRCAPR
jgi:hypothetical protein